MKMDFLKIQIKSNKEALHLLYSKILKGIIMQRQLNLRTLTEVYDTGDVRLQESFIKLIEDKPNSIKPCEIACLLEFAKRLNDNLTLSQKEGYFIGYRTKSGLSEEFDILRFSKNTILNIEMKYKLPNGGVEKVLEQLMRHRHLLSVLKKDVITVCYLYDKNIFYELTGNDTLEIIDISKVSDLIDEDYLYKNELLEADISKLIISPYSEPERFSQHKYCLTDEQNTAKGQILSERNSKIGIFGGAGTGKSILLFDLAKELRKEGKRVVILICASLENYSEISEKLDIEIFPIKHMKNLDLDKYDIIMVDEGQRLYKEQFENIINLNQQTIVISADHRQTLHNAEFNLNIEERIKKDQTFSIKSLKNKIRCNDEMATFIKILLNKNEKNKLNYEFSKIDLVYFDSQVSANTFINNMYFSNDYQPIELTEYETKTTGVTKRQNYSETSKSVHATIGNEYSNVLVVLDKYFYYNNNSELRSSYNEWYPYIEHSSIFQALTRVKERLMIVVIENKQLFIEIQQILNNE